LRPREIIGPPDCPILTRWTLIKFASKGKKLLLHHFHPNADDRDLHDHPWPFVTIVLWGSYNDMKHCVCIAGRSGRAWSDCDLCDGTGFVVREHMRVGKVRYRSASHRHRTMVGPRGCWTLVITGPMQRDWGFWRDGRFWPWRSYEDEFGFAMRCDDLEKEYRK
jgi:hypothetical protein